MLNIERIKWKKYNNGEDIIDHLRNTLNGKALFNDLIDTAFKRYPDKTAIIFDKKRYTYHELDQKSMLFANALRNRGVSKGDKIALLMNNSADYLFAYFGITRTGAVVVPINYRFVAREFQYVLSHSDSTTIVLDSEYYHIIYEIIDTLPNLKTFIVNDVSVPSGAFSMHEMIDNSHVELFDLELFENDDVAIYYTSGTTGKPKGAVLSQKNWAFAAETFCESMEFQPDDIFQFIIPIFHIGFEYIIALIHASSTIFIQEFDVEEVLKGMEREQSTIFWGAPAMYILMLNSPNFKKYNLSSMRVLIYGAAIMPEEIIKRLMRSVKNVKLWNGYGMTECSGHCSWLSEEFCYSKPGSVGKGNTFLGVSIRVCNNKGNDVQPGLVGEVLVRGPNIMKGYYKNQAATKETIDAEGWLHTGDLARIDDEGYIYIVDRKKNMIVRGGENVYPAEIENVLYEHPAILEAAVIGIPHTVLGQDQKAFVVLKDGYSPKAEEIVEFCRKNLASYKVPRKIEFLDDLPKNASQKVLKNVLSERAL